MLDKIRAHRLLRQAMPFIAALELQLGVIKSLFGLVAHIGAFGGFYTRAFALLFGNLPPKLRLRASRIGAERLMRGIKLLRGAGVPVEEKTLRWADFLEADEIFTTGNYAKVTPITRIEQRHLQPGPVYAKARQLYWDYAHGRFGM